MKKPAPQDVATEPPLYCDDRELHRRIAPHLGWESFKAALRACEAADPDFPRVKALWRGRYFPGVKRWLDGNQGAGRNAAGSNARTAPDEDGPEHFDAAPKKPARVQARPPRPAVLDGEPDPRPAGAGGFSRTLHSVTGGRD
jgi:hypothetical protein